MTKKKLNRSGFAAKAKKTKKADRGKKTSGKKVRETKKSPAKKSATGKKKIAKTKQPMVLKATKATARRSSPPRPKPGKLKSKPKSKPGITDKKIRSKTKSAKPDRISQKNTQIKEPTSGAKAKKIKQSPVSERNAREAVRLAQHSTIDLIRDAAEKINHQKNKKPAENKEEYMNVLTPRRRGRPPKTERSSSGNRHVYEPEFNGLMEEKPFQENDNSTQPGPFAHDNETIDFWTDDDIPMARGWKKDVLDF